MPHGSHFWTQRHGHSWCLHLTLHMEAVNALLFSIEVTLFMTSCYSRGWPTQPNNDRSQHSQRGHNRRLSSHLWPRSSCACLSLGSSDGVKDKVSLIRADKLKISSLWGPSLKYRTAKQWKTIEIMSQNLLPRRSCRVELPSIKDAHL